MIGIDALNRFKPVRGLTTDLITGKVTHQLAQALPGQRLIINQQYLHDSALSFGTIISTS